MANDRIYMTCRGCKDITSLAKYYPPSMGHGVWNPEKVVAFIDKHIECSPNFGKGDLGGDRCFDLWTESDPAHVDEFNAWMKKRNPND